MKIVIGLAIISLLSLQTFAHPLENKRSDIAENVATLSNKEHARLHTTRSEKLTMSVSDAAAYSKAQDLYLTKRKEYNEQKLQSMMVETGPVRRDMENGLEYYRDSMDAAKRQVEVYEARFETSGKSKLV